MHCRWQGGHGVFSGATCDECDAIQRCPISLGGLACTHGTTSSTHGDSTCSQCEAGYIPTEPTPTACIGTPCADTVAPDHGSIISSGATPLRFPSTIKFACADGYVLSDYPSLNRTCTTDGRWSSTFPTCIETCDTSPCRNGAICTDEGNLAGGKGEFKCECPSEDGKPFWEGKRCDQDVNECNDPGRLNRPKPWDLNGGCDHKIAVDNGALIPLARCVNETGGFSCAQCLSAHDCCEQGDQGGSHQLPCGGTEFNTQCSVESRAWTEAGCNGPATAHDSTFVFEPAWFVAGGLIEVHLTPLDVNKRLSADNGITSTGDLRGLVHFACIVPRASCIDAPSQTLDFSFNSTGRVYVAQHLETTSATYRLNISVHDQLGDGPHWQEIKMLSSVEFHVVPAPADASHTVFGGCYFGTSTRLGSCYCVEEDGVRLGCRSLPGVRNSLTIVLRDQFDNIRDPTVISTITHPATQKADVVTAEVVGAALVTYDHPPAWAESPDNSSSYLFEFTMTSTTEHSYTLSVFVNGEVAETTPFEYIFHTSLNASKCDDLRCEEFYEPSRFSNLSRWTAQGSTVEEECRAAGCLFVSEPNNRANKLAITLADPLAATTRSFEPLGGRAVPDARRTLQPERHVRFGRRQRFLHGQRGRVTR